VCISIKRLKNKQDVSWFSVKTAGGESDVTVSVGGVALPAMEPGRMREVVRSALLTFDIIQFNLVGLLQRLD
jgi:hypothetical protein